jgi:hypothetical protein
MLQSRKNRPAKDDPIEAKALPLLSQAGTTPRYIRNKHIPFYYISWWQQLSSVLHYSIYIANCCRHRSRPSQQFTARGAYSTFHNAHSTYAYSIVAHRTFHSARFPPRRLYQRVCSRALPTFILALPLLQGRPIASGAPLPTVYAEDFASTFNKMAGALNAVVNTPTLSMRRLHLIVV